MLIQACVVGIKDEMAGEKPKAFVVLSAAARVKIGQDPEQLSLKQTEIFDFMKDQTIRYKHLSGGVDFINVCLLRLVAGRFADPLMNRKFRKTHQERYFVEYCEIKRTRRPSCDAKRRER